MGRQHQIFEPLLNEAIHHFASLLRLVVSVKHCLRVGFMAVTIKVYGVEDWGLAGAAKWQDMVGDAESRGVRHLSSALGELSIPP